MNDKYIENWITERDLLNTVKCTFYINNRKGVYIRIPLPLNVLCGFYF